MLSLINTEVKYQDVILVLRGVSLTVPDAGIVCLLGANGAGKTTSLKAITGMLKFEDGKVTDGTIEFNGKRIDQLDAEIISRMGIMHIMEGRRVLEHLTIHDNLRAGTFANSEKYKESECTDIAYHYFPRLKMLRKRTAGYLSGGEQQQLVVGRALAARPKVMLLDEPSLGLSPALQIELFKIISNISKEQSIGILLVEQNARMALTISNYGYVMENGRIVLDGPSAKLSNNEDVKEFYLGLSELGGKKSYREVKHYKRRKRWL